MDIIYKNARTVVVVPDYIEVGSHKVAFLRDYIEAYSTEELSNIQANWARGHLTYRPTQAPNLSSRES